MVNRSHEAAQKFLAEGLPLVPLQKGTKRPACRNWQEGEGAICDVDQLNGGDLGALITNGVVGIDIDVKHVDGLAQFNELTQGLNSLPDTLRTRTASGGWHLYFRLGKDHDFCGPIKRDDLGIEVYTGARQFVAIMDGYEIHGEEIAEAPIELLERLSSMRTKAAAHESSSNVARKGGRNSKLTSIAGSLRKQGADEDTILKALQSYNAQQCIPPLNDAEVATIATSVAKYEPESKPEITPFSTSIVYSSNDAWQLELPERNYMIEGVLPETSLSMLYSERGLGKTWLSTSIALSVAKQQKLLAWDVAAARRVLFVDGEMPAADLQQRFMALSPDPAPLLDVIFSELLYQQIGEGLMLNNQEHQDRFRFMLDDLEAESRRPELIIFDNLSAMTFGVDENSNSEQDQILKFMRELRHAGFSVMFVHHAGKSGDQRGASRREDFLDLVIKLNSPQIKSHDRARFELEFTKTRGKHPQPDKLNCELAQDEGGQLQLCYQQTSEPTTPEWLLILRLVRDQKPATQKDIVESTGKSKSTISGHVQRLRRDGLIEKRSLTITQTGYETLESGAQKFSEEEF